LEVKVLGAEMRTASSVATGGGGGVTLADPPPPPPPQLARSIDIAQTASVRVRSILHLDENRGQTPISE
jgi:hypothetical protein